MTPRLAAALLAFGLAGAALTAPPARSEISAEPTGPVVTVDRPEALEQAYLDLSVWADGGGIVLLAAGFPSMAEIALSGGGPNPVHVTSADPENPVRVTRIALDGVDNLRLSRIHVDSSAMVRREADRDVDITRSTRIELTDSLFTSDGSVIYDPADPAAVLGERLSMIADSDTVTVSNNRIRGYEQGLTFRDTRRIRVVGNDITAIQGDGIRLVGVEDVLIADNVLHDFSATPNEFTHSDFIQMWSRNTEIVSRDVTITGNVFDTGNGVAVQGIWLGNPAYISGDTDHVYENIIIVDNLIYTGAANGIGVIGADNVVIEDNTLLWNRSAVTVKAEGDTSFFPRIRLHEDITGARVSGNLTTRILHGPMVEPRDNILISWTPGDADYAGRHFVALGDGGDIGPYGWRLRAESPWAGAGASASQPAGADRP
jgi:hypothetical protein